MALIPDTAIDRFKELSKGARLLYVFLCRCRNRETGRCFPSVATTQEALEVNRGTVFALRRELASKAWAIFDGDEVTGLLGFASLKNQTTYVEKKEVIPEAGDSLKNQTPSVETIEVAESLKNQTCFPVNESEKSDSKSLKNQTRYIRNNHGNINHEKKDMHVWSGKIREIFAYWQYRLNKHQAKLSPDRKAKIQARLKDGYTVEQIKQGIDGNKASPYHQGANDTGAVYDDIELICRNGSKLENFIRIAENGANGHGKNQPRAIPRNETHNERAARETFEWIEQSLAATNGDFALDPEDAIPEGITIDGWQ